MQSHCEFRDEFRSTTFSNDHIILISRIHLVITRPVLSELMKTENGFPKLQLVLLNTHPTLDYVQNLPSQMAES